MPLARKNKIILDTNVLVSALIKKDSPPYHILYERVFADKDLQCNSPHVMNEYHAVLNRKKFARYSEFVENARYILARIEELALEYQPEKTHDIIKDESDNIFIDLAVASNANYIITGNTNDFTMSEYKNTRIVTPSEYLSLVKEQ